MYMNSNQLTQANHLIPPQSQPFIRSQSDAANDPNNSMMDSNKVEEGEMNNTNNNGVRMKRYNSLPDVQEYLDPNLNNLNNNNNNNNVNLPSIMQQHSMNPNPMNTLFAAFNQNNRKMMDKTNTNYFMNQHPTASQIHNTGLPNIITTSSATDNLIGNNNLSLPLSAGISMPLSAGLNVPLSAGLSVSSDVMNLSHASSAPHSPIFNVEQSMSMEFTNNNENNYLNETIKKEDMYNSMNMNYNHPSNSLRNVNMSMVNSNHMSPISPHFSNTNTYHPYYQDQMMLSNQIKRARVEENMFNNHQYSNMYLQDSLPIPITIQNPPAADQATAQAAQEAINLSSHTAPPTDDSDPEAIPRRQHLRYPGDLYTPQWVRFGGHKKEGYCDLCSPGKWLQLKNSAYWYHKQFYHGISSVSGKFFSGPIQSRQKDAEVIEGLCHQCQQWIQMSSAKRRNSVLWFRHAHKCHVYHKPKSIFGKRN